jgi:hypothetical protein
LRVPAKVLAPAAAAVATLCIAPAAEAATVATPVSCVRVIPGVPTLPVNASGFTANSPITFTANGQAVGTGTTDPAGGFDNTANPFDPNGILPANKNTSTFQLSASDAAGVAAAPITVPIARVRVTGPTHRVKPHKRVRLRVFGFAPGKKVYLHVRRKSKTKGTFSLGKADSPCGNTSKRIRFMPLEHYAFGTYTYAFSQKKKYSKKTTIYVAKVTITRTFKSVASQATAASWR